MSSSNIKHLLLYLIFCTPEEQKLNYVNADMYAMLDSSTLSMLVTTPSLNRTHKLTLYSCGIKTFGWSKVFYWFTPNHNPISKPDRPKVPSLNRETLQLMNACNETNSINVRHEPLWIKIITSQPLLSHGHSLWNSTILITNQLNTNQHKHNHFMHNHNQFNKIHQSTSNRNTRSHTVHENTY